MDGCSKPSDSATRSGDQVPSVLQVAPAFANKAIDAAVLIQPTVATIEAAGLAVPWIDPDDVIRPTPMFISGTIVNTDWVKRQPDAARRFFYAVMRGVRYYCTAYHGGSNRGEVIAIINKHTAIKDPEFLDRTTWLSRTASGLVPVSSLMDIQDFYLRERMITKRSTLDEMVDMSLVKAADDQLGPFEPPAGSTKAGCR